MKTALRSILFLLLTACFIASVYAQEPVRTGWWKFDDQANLIKVEAGFGSDLELVGNHQAVVGPAADNGAARIAVGSYYKMTHSISANGGGADVAVYRVELA